MVLAWSDGLQIVNDGGSFTWGVGGNNVAAGVAGSNEI